MYHCIAITCRPVQFFLQLTIPSLGLKCTVVQSVYFFSSFTFWPTLLLLSHAFSHSPICYTPLCCFCFFFSFVFSLEMIHFEPFPCLCYVHSPFFRQVRSSRDVLDNCLRPSVWQQFEHNPPGKRSTMGNVLPSDTGAVHCIKNFSLLQCTWDSDSEK